jgi:hypothetical protein
LLLEGTRANSVDLKTANFKKSSRAADVYIAFDPKDAVPTLFLTETSRKTRCAGYAFFDLPYPRQSWMLELRAAEIRGEPT